MAEEKAPFELLKSFSGLIHRQPLFNANGLGVDGYHFTFLDQQGNLLADDSALPEFVEKLADIIPSISDKKNLLLTVPSSWSSALAESRSSLLNITLDLNDDSQKDDTRFNYATHLSTHSETIAATALIDLNSFSVDVLPELIPKWKDNFEITCAQNVNSVAQYQLCKAHAIDIVEGDFYSLPSAKEKHKISPSMQTLMELLVKLQDPEVEPEDLADTINHDISLSYKLLRLVNSAFFGLPREVSSTKQAIVMLGQTKIKTWASLLGLSGVDDKPVELRIIAMTRARMCELLAKYYKGQSELFFAAGLFSTLNALMDTEMAVIAGKLPLSDELKSALLDHQGPAGEALNTVLNYEKGAWSDINYDVIPQDVLVGTYLDAIHWAKELHVQLQS
jgi:EAL and modified HD-GYP domain-containing signal transduction protein